MSERDQHSAAPTVVIRPWVFTFKNSPTSPIKATLPERAQPCYAEKDGVVSADTMDGPYVGLGYVRDNCVIVTARGSKL